MTVFAPRRTARRPKMAIVRCCGWRSRLVAGSRRAMPICFHRRHRRSVTGWSLSNSPPASPRRSARAAPAGAGFSARGSHRSKQVTLWRNGGARIVINHQPHSWADHFYQRHGYRSARWRCGSTAARRLSLAPARWGMPPAGRRRAERNADPGDLRPDGSWSISSTPGGDLRARLSPARWRDGARRLPRHRPSGAGDGSRQLRQLGDVLPHGVWFYART